MPKFRHEDTNALLNVAKDLLRARIIYIVSASIVVSLLQKPNEHWLLVIAMIFAGLCGITLIEAYFRRHTDSDEYRLEAAFKSFKHDVDYIAPPQIND